MFVFTTIETIIYKSKTESSEMPRNKYCSVWNETAVRLEMTRKGLMQFQYIHMYYSTNTN